MVSIEVTPPNIKPKTASIKNTVVSILEITVKDVQNQYNLL